MKRLFKKICPFANPPSCSGVNSLCNISKSSNINKISIILNNHNLNTFSAENQTVLKQTLTPKTLTTNSLAQQNESKDTHTKNHVDAPNIKLMYNINTLFSIVYINIRSLNKNFDKINQLILNLAFTPDIIGVSETWLTKDKYFLYSLNNYTFIHQPCKGNVGGSGLFIKSGIQFKRLDKIQLNLKDCDDIWAELTLHNNRKLVISNIYRNPSPNFNDFQINLSNSINELITSNKKFAIGGDFNIDLLKNNSKNTIFANHMDNLGIWQTVRCPTRITWKLRKTLLDHVYTNLLQKEIHTETLCFDISDHLPNIVLINSLKRQTYNRKKQWKRNDKNFVENKYLNDLKLNLETISNNNLSGNENWNIFIKIFESTLNKHSPLQLISKREQKLHQNPWISKEIKLAIKHKHQLYKKLLSKTEHNDKEWAKYKIIRNKLTRDIEKSKQLYHNSKINQVSSNPKKLWRTINNIVQINKSNTTEDILLKNDNNLLINNKQEISNTLNDYFTTIGINLSNKIPNIDKIDSNSYVSNIKNYHNTFFLKHISNNEVINYIKSLNTNKKTRSDCPQIKYIKLSSEIISPILTKIINQCIDEDIFPDDLKVAEITPIFKKGVKTNPTNWRPISILSPFSKVYERHIYNNLISFIEKYNILHQFQYGFRRNSSTEDALAHIHEYLAQNMDQNNITCAIFIDFRKAFDTVDHDILITKLAHYGIRGKTSKLLTNYLTNRIQSTIANGIKSSNQEVSCGVPQGSILASLFFILYINDITNCSNFDVKLFADDACLLYSHKNHHQLEKNVNTELQKIHLWTQINKLTINYDKTNYLIFSNRNDKTNLNLTMNNHKLIRETETKYLGVMLNEKLKWENHIKYITKKISRTYFILTKIRYYVNTKTLILIYNSLAYTYFNYCICTWGGAPESILKPLKTLQNKITRIITFSDYKAHSDPLYFKLNILRLKDIYELKLAIMIHKIHKGFKIDKTKNLTKIEHIHSHNTRLSKSHNYYTNFRKTNIGQSTPIINGTKIWRNIPEDIKNSSTTCFKSKFTKILIDKYSL